jgi:hypothetical protein
LRENETRSGGREVKRKPYEGDYRRAKLLEYHGENRASFECPDGHRFQASVMPKSPLGKLPSEDVCAFMARRWQAGGVRIDCPKCKREKNAHVAAPFRQILNGIA